MRVASLEAEQDPFAHAAEEAPHARLREVSAERAGTKQFHRQRFVLEDAPKGMRRPGRVNGTIRIEKSMWAVLVFDFSG